MAKGWPKGVTMAEMQDMKAKYGSDADTLEAAVRKLQTERGHEATYTAKRTGASSSKPKATPVMPNPFQALGHAANEFEAALLWLNAEFSVDDIERLESARILLLEISRKSCRAEEGIELVLTKLRKEAALIAERDQLAEENEALRAELEEAKQALSATGHSDKVAAISRAPKRAKPAQHAAM